MLLVLCRSQAQLDAANDVEQGAACEQGNQDARAKANAGEWFEYGSNLVVEARGLATMVAQRLQSQCPSTE